MILASFISLYVPSIYYLNSQQYNSIPSLSILTLLECFFLFDVIFKARTLFHNRDGDKVTSTRLIACRYFRSKSFCLDLTLLFPLHLFTLMLPYWLSLCGVSLKALRLIRYYHLQTKILSQNHVARHSKLFILLFYFIYFIYILNFLWLFVTLLEEWIPPRLNVSTLISVPEVESFLNSIYYTILLIWC